MTITSVYDPATGRWVAYDSEAADETAADSAAYVPKGSTAAGVALDLNQTPTYTGFIGLTFNKAAGQLSPVGLSLQSNGVTKWEVCLDANNSDKFVIAHPDGSVDRDIVMISATDGTLWHYGVDGQMKFKIPGADKSRLMTLGLLVDTAAMNSPGWGSTVPIQVNALAAHTVDLLAIYVGTVSNANRLFWVRNDGFTGLPGLIPYNYVNGDAYLLTANAGFYSNKGLGFFGVTPPAAKPAAIASPTSDALGTKAAIDSIRTVLTNYGMTA